MASRINIDSDLESNYEFEKLAKILGDADCARGKLIRFFRIAQERYGHNLSITQDEIQANDLQCMVDSGWAVPCSDGGYMARGARDQFGWYRQKVQAGQKSGTVRNEKATALSGVERNGNGSEPPSPSPAPTKILKEERLKESAPALSVPALPALVSKKPDARKSTPEESKAVSRLIAAYIPAWQQRHKTRARPNVGGAQQGILRRLIRDHPTDYLCELIQVYCQMQHKFFDDRKHDLATFERCFNQIALAHDRGDENSIDWVKVFGNDDGPKGVSGPNPQAIGDVQRTLLPDGTG